MRIDIVTDLEKEEKRTNSTTNHPESQFPMEDQNREKRRKIKKRYTHTLLQL